MRNGGRAISFLAGMLLAAAPFTRAGAETPAAAFAALFDQGNRLYRAEDYAGARQSYESILEAGYEAPSVYYNLGNAALKQNDIGRAVWAFARANRLSPGDGDIRANLGYARALTRDARPEPSGSRFLAWLGGLSARLPSPEVLKLSLVLYWIASLAVAVVLLWPRFLRAAAPVAWTAGALLVLGLFVGVMKAVVTESRETAVVLPESLSVQSAPGAEGKTVFTLHAGTEVSLDRSLGGWVEISLSSELKGWVPEDSIASI
jgi:hypothetical protein